MRLNISYACVRYLFFAFNVPYWLLGCCSLGIGIWLYVVKHNYDMLTPSNFGATSASGLCIATGALMIVLGFIGCCGAVVESKCLLITYLVFVFVVFIVQLVAGILGMVVPDNVAATIRAQMILHLQQDYVSDVHSKGARITWDRLQIEFSCCGVDSYKDWYRNKQWPDKDYVRDSCCIPEYFKLSTDKCGTSGPTDKWFQQGCFTAFHDWLLEHLHVVGVLGLSVATFSVFGLVIASMLYQYIRKHKMSFAQYSYYRTPVMESAE